MKMKRAILLALATPAILAAQQLPNLPRSVTGAGLNDSALTLVSDSARRTRAASVAQVRKALSLKPFDSLATTQINLTSATAVGAATWGSQQVFATGQRVDSATGSARSQKLTTARTLAVTGDLAWTSPAFDGSGNVTAAGTLATVNANVGTFGSGSLVPVVTVNGKGLVTAVTTSATSVSFPLRAPDGTALAPSYSWANGTSDGLYKVAGSTIYGFSLGGNDALTIDGTRQIIWAGSGTSGSRSFQSGSGSPGMPSFGLGAKASPADTNTGMYLVSLAKLGFTTGGVASLSISGGASPTVTGGTGNFTLLAGTGNSRQLSVQTTTSTGVATTAARINEKQQTLFATGSGPNPSISFLGDSLIGFYRNVAGGFAVQAGGVTTEQISGVRHRFDVQIQGDGGSAGSPAFAPFSTDTVMGMFMLGAGTPSTDTIAFSVNSVTQMKMGASGVLRLPLLPAEGATKNAVCWDGVTFNVTQNAAATCTVSSRRFKTNIKSLTCSDANRMVAGLRPVSYEEKVGGSRRLGIIAEEADSIDSRLASRDAKGLITSTNYEEVFTALLRVEQCSGKH